MLDVSNDVKNAYMDDGTNAQVYLSLSDGTTLSPRDIVSGSISIDESLCSGTQIDLSEVNKNALTFTVGNINQSITDLQGKTITAVHRLTVGSEDVDIPLGKYTIVQVDRSGDYRLNVTAYDDMYVFDNITVDDWWNQLTFPITIRNLMVSFFTYCGFTWDDMPLAFPNYDVVIESKPADIQNTTATQFLGYIQEVIGGFIKVDRYGRLRFATGFENAVLPSLTLYPSETLLPHAGYDFWNDQDIKRDYTYRQIVANLTVADYDVERIDKVQIKSTENTTGIIYGTGTNAYIIDSNPLLFGVSDSTGRAIAKNLFFSLNSFAYRPFKAKLTAQPYVEVGDWVRLTTLKGTVVVAPILSRTLYGPRLCFDNLETNGQQRRAEVTSVNRAVKVLNNKVHEVVDTVDEFKSTFIDTTENLQSEITQNAEAITTKVSQSDYNGNTVVSMINQTSTDVTISAARLNLEFGEAGQKVTIKENTDGNGVLFEGSGQINFKTSEQWATQNYTPDASRANYIQVSHELSSGNYYGMLRLYNFYEGMYRNRLHFTGSQTGSNVYLTNFMYSNSATDSVANSSHGNDFDMYSSSGDNRAVLRNYRADNSNPDVDADAYANTMVFSASQTANNVSVYNYSMASSNRANYLQLATSSTRNSITLSNADLLYQTAANSVNMYSSSSASQITFNNYVIGSSSLANAIYMLNSSGSRSVTLSNYSSDDGSDTPPIASRLSLSSTSDGTATAALTTNNEDGTVVKTSVSLSRTSINLITRNDSNVMTGNLLMSESGAITLGKMNSAGTAFNSYIAFRENGSVALSINGTSKSLTYKSITISGTTYQVLCGQ